MVSTLEYFLLGSKSRTKFVLNGGMFVCFVFVFNIWIYLFLKMASPNHLVKSFVAYAALECLLTRMGQSVIFVVSPLVETLSTEIAYERLVPHVNSHVSVEG